MKSEGFENLTPASRDNNSMDTISHEKIVKTLIENFDSAYSLSRREELIYDLDQLDKYLSDSDYQDDVVKYEFIRINKALLMVDQKTKNKDKILTRQEKESKILRMILSGEPIDRPEVNKKIKELIKIVRDSLE